MTQRLAIHDLQQWRYTYDALQHQWLVFLTFAELIQAGETRDYIEMPIFGKRLFVRYDFGLTVGFLTYGFVDTFSGVDRRTHTLCYAIAENGLLYEVENGVPKETPSQYGLFDRQSTRHFHSMNVAEVLKRAACRPPVLS